MATIKPFAALRPRPELAAQICELPYDVMSSAEARKVAASNPLSFLRVSKPEIDLPPGTDLYSPEVYVKGRENFQRLIAQGALRQDAKPCFYLYRQVLENQAQVGLVAVVSCQDYLEGIVRKHELTRHDKEDDRVRHIEALNSQTGPVFLVYGARHSVDEFAAHKTVELPEIDFVARDGVRHTAWVIARDSDLKLIEAEFSAIPALYIADGHHRSAAAARVYQTREQDPRSRQSAFFLSVLFPHNQVRILPYNRVLKDLNGLSPRQLIEKLECVFVIQPDGPAAPPCKHQLGLCIGSRWYSLRFRPHLVATTDAVEELDVTLLQKHALDPIFGINNPRTSQRIQFVGGIRGTSELEKLVSAGQAACAFSLFPTRVEDLMTIADRGGMMPPKSTWFEPKLRDGMFCHVI